jgi:predicted amidohydrolase
MKKFLGLILLLATISVQAELIPIREVFSPDPVNYPSSRFMKVAVLQWASKNDAPLNVGQDQVENYKHSLRLAITKFAREAKAQGASLLVTPELSTVGYPNQPEFNDNFSSPSQAMPFAELAVGKTFKYFSALALELKMYINIGFLEKDNTNSKLYNSVMAIDPNGKLLVTYRKQNLFYGENRYIEAGSDSMTFETPAGKIGVAICADIYDSSVMNDYLALKLDALLVPASWTIHNSAYSYFVRAATWVNAPILGSNHTYFPDSGVVNANGTAQSHIRQSAGLAYGFLPLK